MLSVVVFTAYPEEEHLIGSCLESVKWADEIVVIKGEITPKTLQIIKKYTNKIYHDTAGDFAGRHNLGKEKSRGDWILYVDADERISAELAGEIQERIKSPDASAYKLNRVNIFLGKKVRFGDRFPDNITRLFKRNDLVEYVGTIHESSRVTGTIGKLDAPFYHLTHRDIYSMMRKTIYFSEFEAKLRLDANHPPIVWWRLVRVILTEAFNRIIRMQGFRQGTEGWIDGLFQAFSLFVVYARLWEMQRKPTLNESYRQIDENILKEFSK